MFVSKVMSSPGQQGPPWNVRNQEKRTPVHPSGWIPTENTQNKTCAHKHTHSSHSWPLASPTAEASAYSLALFLVGINGLTVSLRVSRVSKTAKERVSS